MSEVEALKEALKNNPQLNSHTPEMLNCSVTVRKLPETIASALAPKTTKKPQEPSPPPPPPQQPTKKNKTKKQTVEEAKANKYCFACHQWFTRPYRLQMHIRLVSFILHMRIYV